VNQQPLSRVKVMAQSGADERTFTRESRGQNAGMMALLSVTFTRESDQAQPTSKGLGGRLKATDQGLWPWIFTRESPPDPTGKTGNQRRAAMTATHK